MKNLTILFASIGFFLTFASCDLTEDFETSGCFVEPCFQVKLVENCCSVIRFSAVAEDSTSLDLNISSFIAKNYCKVATQLNALNLTNEELKEKVLYVKIQDRDLLSDEQNDCAVCEMYCPNDDPDFVVSICGVKDETETNPDI